MVPLPDWITPDQLFFELPAGDVFEAPSAQLAGEFPSRAFLVGYRKVYSVRCEADVVMTSVTRNP